VSVRWIVVAREAEAVMGVEPADPRVKPLVSPAHFDRWRPAAEVPHNRCSSPAHEGGASSGRSASTSMVMRTSSPTTKPVSRRSAFQLTPKSWRREADPRVVEGRAALAQIADVQGHGAGHPANRQIARHAVLMPGHRHHARGAEQDPWMLRHVEEVRAAQVVVAPGLTRPERRGIDARLGPRVLRVVGIEFERPLEVLEGPPDERDHHVPHGELGRGVCFVEGPPSHRPSPPCAGADRLASRVSRRASSGRGPAGRGGGPLTRARARAAPPAPDRRRGALRSRRR
jgi:hypothetical protein